jgi:hypothetical protein
MAVCDEKHTGLLVLIPQLRACRALRWEVHPPQQVLEARIGTQRIEARLHLQQSQPGIALPVRPFQPAHGLVFVT